MAPGKPVDAGVLAVWKAKYAALGKLIEVYEEAERIGALGGVFDPADLPSTVSTPGAPRTPLDLPVGVFRDKSIKEAIAIYLGAARRKQTNKEIAVGLQKGGIATTSTVFEATVATALHRMKDDGTVLRFPDGWDLAASYPDSLRARLGQGAKSRRAKTPKSKTMKRKQPKANAASAQKAIYIKVKRTKPSPESADRRPADHLNREAS